MTLDTALVGLAVAGAALYLLLPLIMPTHLRTQMGHRLMGKPAPCAPNATTQGCGIGCSGCALPKRKDDHAA